MFVAQTLRLLLRRWRLVALTLLLGVVAGSLATLRIAPSYEVGTSLLFLSPGVVPSEVPGGAPRRINPFVNFSQDLFIARDVVSARLAADEVLEQLDQAGLRGVYAITPATEGTAPIMVITVDAATADAAKASAKLVSDRVQAELRAQQKAAAAPDDSYITSTVLSPPTKAKPLRKKQLQAGVMAFAGLVVIGLLMIAVDERRRARRRGATAPEVTSEATWDPTQSGLLGAGRAPIPDRRMEGERYKRAGIPETAASEVSAQWPIPFASVAPDTRPLTRETLLNSQSPVRVDVADDAHDAASRWGFAGGSPAQPRHDRPPAGP
jgi:capsular polysaccharide biosynthesis protein